MGRLGGAMGGERVAAAFGKLNDIVIVLIVGIAMMGGEPEIKRFVCRWRAAKRLK